MKLVEIVASDEIDPTAREAQQRFVALEFPARFGSKVMKHLLMNFQSLSELGFGHLKRLKKHPEIPQTLVALVCPLDCNDQSIETPCQKLQEMETMYEARLTTASALRLAPCTRKLFEKHTKQWPLIFHASVEEAATLSEIEEVEMENMMKRLSLAVDLGEKLREEGQKTLSCASVCVVVDPEVDELVATSEVSAEMPCKYKFRTLYHPVMVSIDVVAERDRRQGEALDGETAHKKQKCIDGDATADLEKDERRQRQSYLCTGYDVYLDREPCAMCAMALVHSRVRRVIFDRANPGDGVLVSSFKLHTIKSLNHHYRVFQLAVSSEKEAME
ncbi:hypothetical protein KXD40_000151 [Peronospora effusa]|uniref:CMP/dCMP-type deaminase domain-containing protein n=1 Tax=Peronospora effusa TaxID=542832 RepID=A0A3M6VJI0_9STRA|nr:hypothetical protein DD238_001239 [Peronospora effusa]RQM17221.1 hypothetical protein DD237_001847 [Peronospora effusa]UIZ21448.1 hypothetical protein KXD40_000151 [Peronospora effusa]CAI5718481.1 unnamed protein product [Peronospora effusa]